MSMKAQMKHVFLVGLVSMLALATPSAAMDLPRYDSDAYCLELAQYGGGAADLVDHCIALEGQALALVIQRWPTLSMATQQDCIQITLMGGESYDLLKTCIDKISE